MAYMWNQQIKLDNQHVFNNNDPIESMRSVKIYNYDQEGAIKNYTSTAFWQFSDRYRISTLKQPMLRMYRGNDYYDITADSATILHQTTNYGISLIKLYSKVKLEQSHPEKSNPNGFNLATEYLEFNPSSETIISDKQVVVYQPGLNIIGTGLQANLRTKQLELQHDVITEYNTDPI